MNVLIIEDHPLIRKGVKMTISEIDKDAEVMQAGDFMEGLSLLEEFETDVVILDIDIPGGEGIRMINRIREKQEDVRILVHSGHDEKLYALPYMQSGADGFLSKTASHDDFVLAWKTIISRQKYVSDKIQEILLANVGNTDRKVEDPEMCLSSRELHVMRLLGEGKSNKEIAITLQLKENTISTYKKRIYTKLNVNDDRSLMKKIELYG
ncbi:response regulator transcription factor [Dyadobacter psychrotolerans]|uniref:Response regulator transcription factor n=1 Tax=Dyadobacter psychrotolerans TaxID=2541721 RepID=A0A4R5DQV7_9BACT|nr:response regulator transcription factor [Dyadobacter psychrotolerans]TDE14431.1 response regulator transcription factor [Dyadobacter psychrotolerans]